MTAARIPFPDDAAVAAALDDSPPPMRKAAERGLTSRRNSTNGERCPIPRAMRTERNRSASIGLSQGRR